ncbi:putative 2'-deoxynucleoside 5'-phosphate N-hydrolase 1 [Saccoglossus kowalevskii]
MGRSIYFCGSIQGGRQDADLYARIIKLLQGYGEVLTEIVGHAGIEKEDMICNAQSIYDQDMEWLNISDVVVAEVTQPSHGVGYEIGRAVAMRKRVLCLYRPFTSKWLSCMIRGAHREDNVTVLDYKEEDLPEIFNDFFANI